MTAISTLPAARFALLGYAGLLPFLGCTALIFFYQDGRAFASLMLISYGAVILSFVGALHWAFAMALEGLAAEERRDRLRWSVVPALIGWVSLLLPAPWAYVTLVLGFVSHLKQDRKLLESVPGWYPSMRAHLTVVASVCLLLSAVVVFIDR
ncbi:MULTISPECIES: DUF3429 domain-containing protein [Pseudomonas]|jgi:hypothetical protein|uniref:DUF3429 domain-containing protein n=1 Tax=Pseudomonas mosselii TaxID=78327 RepID=A0A5R8ZJQ0_9PSED|nr:DUF3429 domain-containing protein [Pseudomonas mosselii]TLP65066.1 DUF3429 domain-containing protein [Pseudomonas mosselii]